MLGKLAFEELVLTLDFVLVLDLFLQKELMLKMVARALVHLSHVRMHQPVLLLQLLIVSLQVVNVVAGMVLVSVPLAACLVLDLAVDSIVMERSS